MTPDQAADQSHLHPIKTGNLRLELQFATALAETFNVLVYPEFDNLIEINEKSTLQKEEDNEDNDCLMKTLLKQAIWPPCELNISCTSTTAESRAKIWYQ